MRNKHITPFTLFHHKHKAPEDEGKTGVESQLENQTAAL